MIFGRAQRAALVQTLQPAKPSLSLSLFRALPFLDKIRGSLRNICRQRPGKFNRFDRVSFT